MFSTYKVSSPNTSTVYYGYAQGDVEAAMVGFITASKRPDGDDTGRGSSKYVRQCGTTIDKLQFEVVGQYEEEIVAYNMRNAKRAVDKNSINGPCTYPARVHEQAKTKDPKVVERQFALYSSLQLKTARLAYEAGRYSFKTIKQLQIVFDLTTEQLNQQMTTLSPAEFEQKFNITIEE